MSNLIIMTPSELYESNLRAVINAVRTLADVVEREDHALMRLNDGKAYISTQRLRALAECVAAEILEEPLPGGEA